MNTLIDILSEAEREALRAEFRQLEPTAWVVEIAHKENWRVANEEFLKHERDRGRLEMEHLMRALHASPPVSPVEAADLVAAALTLFVAPEDPESAILRPSAATVRVRICDCPVFRRLEASEWRGVTACGSWHRRHGWYDALGIYPQDSVIAESKWGDEVCESLIEFA